MHYHLSNHINRREFLTASSLAGLTALSASADRTSRTDNNATVPPIRIWDHSTDTYTPFFPIGWYSFGSWARIKELAENGSNCALYAGLGREGWQLADTLEQMNIAKQLDMRLVLGLDNSVVGRLHKDNPEAIAVVEQYVSTFKHHPALLGWQLGDEFSAEAAPAINRTVQLIRELGSKHQTWQVHPHTWSHQDVTTLMAKTDVCTYDGYTYLEGMEEFAPTTAARVLAWQQSKTDLILDQGWAGNVNVTQAVGCKCGDVSFRFPTLREYRWNVFSAIATCQARGTMNWIYSYFGGFYLDEEERFFVFRDNVVKPVNLEQRRMAHALATGFNVGLLRTNHDHPTSTAIPPATGPYRKFNKLGRLLLYDDQQKLYYLIVANNEPTTLDINLEMSNLPARPKTLRAIDKYRESTVPIKRSRKGCYQLRDRLNGYDVAIYQIG